MCVTAAKPQWSVRRPTCSFASSPFTGNWRSGASSPSGFHGRSRRYSQCHRRYHKSLRRHLLFRCGQRRTGQPRRRGQLRQRDARKAVMAFTDGRDMVNDPNVPCSRRTIEEVIQNARSKRFRSTHLGCSAISIEEGALLNGWPTTPAAWPSSGLKASSTHSLGRRLPVSSTNTWRNLPCCPKRDATAPLSSSASGQHQRSERPPSSSSIRHAAIFRRRRPSHRRKRQCRRQRQH